ncbi:MAG: hypothetical protein IPP94_04440 [Ignavibacteria bacterium]|nr:hypothetical protein [Ignavibacteria bacterium]
MKQLKIMASAVLRADMDCSTTIWKETGAQAIPFGISIRPAMSTDECLRATVFWPLFADYSPPHTPNPLFVFIGSPLPNHRFVECAGMHQF